MISAEDQSRAKKSSVKAGDEFKSYLSIKRNINLWAQKHCLDDSI